MANFQPTQIFEHIEKISTWNPRISSDSKPFTYVDLSSVDQGKKEICKTSLILPNEAPSRARQLISKNDVLVATVRPNLNAVALVSARLDGATASTGFCVLRPNQKTLDSRYLYHWVQNKIFIENMMSKATGASYPAISDKIIKESTIPTPKIEEQKRIAAILDKAHSIRQKRQQNLENADALIKSIFLDMFGDPVINPMGWKPKEFDFFADIDTKMTTDFEKYSEQPHIGIDSIEKETGNLVRYRTVKEDNLVSGKYIFTPKHIIYSKIRPNLNKVALPNFSGLCSADAYPILPKDSCERLYLVHIMRSKLFLEHILPLSGRTNIPKANKEQIRKFVMPLPPIDLQNQFAEIVTKIEAQKAKQKEHLHESNQAFKALQQEYFG